MKNPIVASYTRVSRILGQTIENQAQPIHGFCEARGYDLAPEHEYSDEGVSGAKSRRPRLDRLLRDARAGKINIIIVVALDRLGRDLKHLLTLLDEFESLNIKFISIRENIDLTQPSGRLIMAVIGAICQFERELIRTRTREALAAKKLLAQQTGSKWRCGRPPIQTETKAEVLSLFHRGHSIRKIASILQGQVSKSSVERIIRTHKQKCRQNEAQVIEITSTKNQNVPSSQTVDIKDSSNDQ